MKRNIQILVLFVTLVVPILVFGFLKIFGNNEYALDMINPMEMSQELQVFNPGEVLECQPHQLDGVHRIPDFNFVSQDGQVVTNQSYDGKIYIAEFFFTRCPNICIVMASELLRVQEKFKNYSDIRILSHSVDPDHDSISVLKSYAARYQASSEFWTFVTGDKAKIYEMARCGYFVAVKPSETSSTDFIHTDKVVLVDKQRRIRGYYSATDREDIDRLITEIQVLLKEKNPKIKN